MTRVDVVVLYVHALSLLRMPIEFGDAVVLLLYSGHTRTRAFWFVMRVSSTRKKVRKLSGQDERPVLVPRHRRGRIRFTITFQPKA